jgi:hypothetical protein
LCTVQLNVFIFVVVFPRWWCNIFFFYFFSFLKFYVIISRSCNFFYLLTSLDAPNFVFIFWLRLVFSRFCLYLLPDCSNFCYRFNFSFLKKSPCVKKSRFFISSKSWHIPFSRTFLVFCSSTAYFWISVVD